MKMDGEVVCVSVGEFTFCGESGGISRVYVLVVGNLLLCEVLCFRYIFPFCFVQFIAVLCFFDLLTDFQGKSVSVCGCRVQTCRTQREQCFIWHLALKEPKQKNSCFKRLAVVAEFGATAIAADVGGDSILLHTLTRILTFHTAITLNKQCLTSVFFLFVSECCM